MAKELIKTAGRAALEKTLEQLLPTVLNRLDGIQSQMNELRKHMDDKFEKIDEKFEKIDEKFEKTQEVINELGLRINTIGTKVDTFLEFVTRDYAKVESKVDGYVERLVRVEEGLKNRRRRAG